MITGDQAVKLLIEANPVPDMTSLDLTGDIATLSFVESDSRGGEMTEVQSPESEISPTPGRRRLIAIAALIAAAVAGGIFLAPRTEETPVVAGLPPEGATPSTPGSGELIASMWEHISGRGTFGDGWLYLYADGRLIWQRGGPDYPEPTGWLEQRLTREGAAAHPH